MAKYSLKDSFPINKFKEGYDDIIINNRSEYTIGFSLKLREVFTLEESDYFNMDTILESIIKRVPNHTIIHFQFRYKKLPFTEKDFSRFETERYGIYKAFKFFERALIKDEVYLFFTKTTPTIKKRSKGISLLHKNFIPQELIDPKIEEDFYNAMSSIEDILRNSGYYIIQRLKKTDYNNIEKSNGILADYFSLKTSKEGSVTYDDIDMTNGIQVGNKYASISSVEMLKHFPEYVTPIKNNTKLGAILSYTFGLGFNLRFDHIVNYYIFVDNTATTSKEMQLKRNKLSNFSTISAENRANYEGVSLFVDAITSYERIPVRFYMNIINIADSQQELINQNIEIQSALAEIGFVSKINLTDKAEIFWAGCPGNAGDLPSIYTSTLLLDQVISLIPKESAYRNSTSTFGITLCDRITGYPLNVDFIFEPKKLGIIPNFNAFTLGPSGSGKSFMTNAILRSLFNNGNHIVIVDMGRSYYKLSKEVGGKYIDPTANDFPGFNPFLINKNDFNDERIEIIAKLIIVLWYQDKGEISKETEEILKQLIDEYYRKSLEKGFFLCFNGFYDYVTQKHNYLLKEIENGVVNDNTAVIQKNFFDFDSFKIVLKKYSRGGRFEKLLNAETVLDLTNDRFVVFEIENIKDNMTLMNLQVLMIMDVFLTKLLKLGEDNPTLKTLLIEEAWKSMMNKSMAEFLKYSVKTFRKYNGQLNTVTQEIDDLLGNEIVKNSIVNSSPIKILLDPGSYREQIDTVANLLSLTDYQKKLYTSLNKNNDPNLKYKEVLIITLNLAMVYRLEVSDYEYAMFTTNADEVAHLKKLENDSNGNMELAMLNFTENNAQRKLKL